MTANFSNVHEKFPGTHAGRTLLASDRGAAFADQGWTGGGATSRRCRGSLHRDRRAYRSLSTSGRGWPPVRSSHALAPLKESCLTHFTRCPPGLQTIRKIIEIRRSISGTTSPKRQSARGFFQIRCHRPPPARDGVVQPSQSCSHPTSVTDKNRGQSKERHGDIVDRARGRLRGVCNPSRPAPTKKAERQLRGRDQRRWG
jgi:hypothetical protein